MREGGPIRLAAIATPKEGGVLGFVDMDECREWLGENENWTVWTADGFWRREQDFRVKLEPAWNDLRTGEETPK